MPSIDKMMPMRLQSPADEHGDRVDLFPYTGTKEIFVDDSLEPGETPKTLDDVINDQNEIINHIAEIAGDSTRIFIQPDQPQIAGLWAKTVS